MFQHIIDKSFSNPHYIFVLASRKMTWKSKLNNIYEVSYGLIHNYVLWFKSHDQSFLNYNSMEVEKPSIVGFIRYVPLKNMNLTK